MRFGILNFSIGPYRRLAERWQQLEQLGFDDAWIADDPLSSYTPFESWALLGALARDTHRIRVGTLVTTIRFRHPALLAAQVLTVDHLSGGRAALGIGAGEPSQNETIGTAAWSARESLQRLEEQAAILGVLLRGEPIDHAGPSYPTHVQNVPQPLARPRPPLVVAAHGEIGIRAAARHADAWNCLGGQPYRGGPKPARERGGLSLADAAAETRRLNERVDNACNEIGRDPGSLARTILAYRPDPDPFSSLDAFDDYVGTYAEIGITAIAFFWPPTEEQLANGRATSAAEARFERIVTQRVSRTN